MMMMMMSLTTVTQSIGSLYQSVMMNPFSNKLSSAYIRLDKIRFGTTMNLF